VTPAKQNEAGGIKSGNSAKLAAAGQNLRKSVWQTTKLEEPIMAKAGEVHSIRLPSGAARQLKELTNLSVSAFCRQQVLAMISLKQQEAAKESKCE
jgi:hypothetical protein